MPQPLNSKRVPAIGYLGHGLKECDRHKGVLWFLSS